MTATAYSIGSYRTGERAVVASGRSYVPNGKRRGVVCAHGAGEDASVWFAVPWYMTTFTDYGYPWIGCDFGAPSYNKLAWGNDDSITSVGTAITSLLTAAAGLNAKSDKVCLYGTSMGAITVLNWARQNLSSVLCAALVIPAINLNDIYTNNKGGYQAAVGTAYGVTSPTALPGLATHEPLSFASTDLLGLPIHIWASDNDPIAATTTVSRGWNGAGGSVTVESLGSVGHATTNLDFTKVLAFFDACGGRA